MTVNLTTSLSKEHLRLWVRMLRVSRFVENELREHLRQEFGTTLPRFDVMSALERSNDGLRMSALSQQLMVSNGNVTGIVERLVKDGLVERIPIEDDRRSVKVTLTRNGRAEFSLMAASHEARLHELFADVNFDDAHGIISRLSRVGGHLDAHTAETNND